MRPWLAASDKDQLAAEALADDLVETLSALLARERARSRAVADGLVNSLSELLAREKNAAAAAAAGGVAAGPRAAEWSSFLDGLTGAGGPLEVLGASDSGQETPIAAAAAAAEGPEDALLSEPCDSRFWKLTAAGKEEKDAGQERVVSESRMLRGELASLGGRGETTGAAAAAAVRGGKGRRTLVGGATAAAVGEGQNFAECPEVVETVGEEDFLKIESTWLNVVLTGVCVVCAGLAAGLTMGLLSIEPLEMAIKQRSGKWTEPRKPSVAGVCLLVFFVVKCIAVPGLSLGYNSTRRSFTQVYRRLVMRVGDDLGGEYGKRGEPGSERENLVLLARCSFPRGRTWFRGPGPPRFSALAGKGLQ